MKIHPLEYFNKQLLSLVDLAVSYDGRAIFCDFNLSLRQGARIALQGGNGSGKSSVLKLLCGEAVPHSGNMSIGSRLIISYVPQALRF